MSTLPATDGPEQHGNSRKLMINGLVDQWHAWRGRVGLPPPHVICRIRRTRVMLRHGTSSCQHKDGILGKSAWILAGRTGGMQVVASGLWSVEMWG